MKLQKIFLPARPEGLPIDSAMFPSYAYNLPFISNLFPAPLKNLPLCMNSFPAYKVHLPFNSGLLPLNENWVPFSTGKVPFVSLTFSFGILMLLFSWSKKVTKKDLGGMNSLRLRCAATSLKQYPADKE